MTGADGGGLTGVVLTSAGFESTMAGGQYIVTIALAVFAFTTILGWSYYGERCWQYPLGAPGKARPCKDATWGSRLVDSYLNI